MVGRLVKGLLQRRRAQCFCFLHQARELQMLYSLRKTFVQDVGARIKNVREAAARLLPEGSSGTS